MPDLSEDGKQVVIDLARRFAMSEDAVKALIIALNAGHGSMAQFNHPELGGMGQWSQGGMIMIGDMFNNELKHRVGSLCSELAGLMRGKLFVPRETSSMFADSTDESKRHWWPSALGSPSSTGAQNDCFYAYFPQFRRLAIKVDGISTVYDTGSHQISGFAQQQSSQQSLTFTSQLGTVRVSDLPVIEIS